MFSFDQADGDLCFQGWRLDVAGAEDAEAVEIAGAYLSGLDLDAIDTTAAEAEQRIENATAVDHLTGQPSPVLMSDDEVRQSALGRVVAQMVFAELAEHGHPHPDIGVLSTTTDCR